MSWTRPSQVRTFDLQPNQDGVDASHPEDPDSAPRKGFSVALAGNPNTGKSTLFNALTHSREHVGNWPGKTIERKHGYLLHDGWKIEVVDLPGTYSLTAYSAEETIVQNYLLSERPDLVLAVLDACNLERHLYLVIQILEMRTGVLVALNRGDIAEKRGIRIDTEAVSRMLAGTPVLQIAAQRGTGIGELKDSLVREYQRQITS